MLNFCQKRLHKAEYVIQRAKRDRDQAEKDLESSSRKGRRFGPRRSTMLSCLREKQAMTMCSVSATVLTFLDDLTRPN